MNPAEFIRDKRDGKRLDGKSIGAFVMEYIDGRVTDYQMSAFLMAVYLQGMDHTEAAALTEAYIESGIKIDWADLNAVPVDKHSTGGVGDKVSLILAPLVASCGGFVPMLSGRGLGHTGGTLDKLESIPGFSTELSVERLKRQVRKIGCAIARQSKELAPADGRIYALRDVTATVESIPLIAASIMSKKIAEGAKGLVIDLKTGSGAFMSTLDRAESLAKTLIAIGKAHGQTVRAILTDMSQPLGSAIGNALEAEESILMLKGDANLPRLREVTIKLAAEMLHIAKICDSTEDCERLATSKLDDGSAYEKFAEMVVEQGGDIRSVEDTKLLPKAPFIKKIPAPTAGYIESVDTRAVGIAAVALGAGRLRSDDEVDPAVGFKIFVKIGDRVDADQTIGEVHARSVADADKAIAAIGAAYKIVAEKCDPPKLIIGRLP